MDEQCSAEYEQDKDATWFENRISLCEVKGVRPA